MLDVCVLDTGRCVCWLKSESADVGDELTVLRQVTRCLTSQALENQDDNLEVEGLVRASTEGLRMKDLVFQKVFDFFV